MRKNSRLASVSVKKVRRAVCSSATIAAPRMGPPRDPGLPTSTAKNAGAKKVSPTEGVTPNMGDCSAPATTASTVPTMKVPVIIMVGEIPSREAI